jgi:hypothetical protein
VAKLCGSVLLGIVMSLGGVPALRARGGVVWLLVRSLRSVTAKVLASVSATTPVAASVLRPVLMHLLLRTGAEVLRAVIAAVIHFGSHRQRLFDATE